MKRPSASRPAARRWSLAISLLLTSLFPGALPHAATGGENLIPNGDFHAGMEGWRPLWTRDPGTGDAKIEESEGRNGVRITHRGTRDWSFTQGQRLPVQPGDMFVLSARLTLEGDGSATLGVITYDAQGPVDWSFGGQEVRGQPGIATPRTRLIIPDGVAAIEPRLIGNGPAELRLSSISLLPDGNLAELRAKGLPEEITLETGPLVVTLQTGDATLHVLDTRNGRRWQQRPLHAGILVRSVQREGKNLRLDLLHVPTDSTLTALLEPSGEEPEFTFSVAGDLALPGTLAFPHPFVTEPGTHLVVPMNEGISYPVEDPDIDPMRLIAYGGHGICMAFWGVTDGAAGQMAIIETPDDAAIRIDRAEGRLLVAPEWEGQKGRLGYPRGLRYVFFDRGGHVAMAKRYREQAREQGLLKTLTEKRAVNPNVDRLIGAVNVWCWDNDAVGIVKELQAAGIQRILWSNRQPPDSLRALNDLGVLTSRYDIYQDTMNPANFPKLRGTHSDWTTDAWPQDLMLDRNQDWVRGWRVRGRDGEWFPCGVLCDRQAPAYAARRIPAELETHPYLCRFIDTTTASPWRECYSADHPMSRGDSREWKMRLLEYVSQDLGLVTGCETGHDAAVPYVHYFEGMLSLGPYRVPDAGRDMQRIWTEVPERVARFQLGHRYRLPLWQLVYHDCVVAQWYWGDYNNKLPALWPKRDLFNALYGTPPMFMFNRRLWREDRERFVASYQATAPVARATGYSEMVDHRFLTPDRDVQQTRFANGVVVTVNFGGQPFEMADGAALAPGGQRVQIPGVSPRG